MNSDVILNVFVVIQAIDDLSTVSRRVRMRNTRTYQLQFNQMEFCLVHYSLK